MINLGRVRPVTAITPRWTSDRIGAYATELSDDGVTWRPFAAGESARYVSLRLPVWRDGDASLPN